MDTAYFPKKKRAETIDSYSALFSFSGCCKNLQSKTLLASQQTCASEVHASATEG